MRLHSPQRRDISKMMENLKRVLLQAPVVCDYLDSGPANPERLYVLLHGYDQTAKTAAREFTPALSATATWLAPNAPFPMARRKKPEEGGGYRMGFSWYFYDHWSDDYYIDPQPSVGFLEALVRKLSLQQTPTTLIGFSQGGYLAGFVAERLPQVDHVIGVGASFLSEEFVIRPGLRMDAIHGALDDRVEPAGARRQHEQALAKGARGEFILLPETAHAVDDHVRNAIARLVS